MVSIDHLNHANSTVYYQTHMSIVKVIEVLAESPNSWEEATANAVAEAAKSIEAIQSVYIKEMQATVTNNRIDKYRVNAKISFIVQGQGRD
ncbi:hypothetical protein BH23VER1_BH23VER1_15590 [soil metagenome]